MTNATAATISSPALEAIRSTPVQIYLRKWLPTLLLGGLLLYLVAVPIMFLVASSFSDEGLPNLARLSLAHYVEVYLSEDFYTLGWTTSKFALGSAFGALSIAFVMAWLVERSDLPYRGVVRVMILLPMVTPPVLLAVGWALLGSPRIGFFNDILKFLLPLQESPINIFSLGGMILVESLALAPSAFLILSPSLRNMDPNLEEAAATSGAGVWRTIYKVILPLLTPAVFATMTFLLIVGLLTFDIPGALGMPSGIFVLSSKVVYLINESPRGVAEFGVVSAMSMSYLVVVLLLAMVYQRATRQASRFVTVTGKNFRVRQMPLGKLKLPAMAFVLIYFFFASLAPIAVLIWSSLMPYHGAISWAMLQKATLANHIDLLSNVRAITGAGNSLLIAVIASSAVAMISVATAWVVVKSRAPGRATLDTLAFMPIAIPGTMIAMALMYMYLTITVPDIYGSLWIIAIAYITVYLSYGSRAMRGVLMQLHQDLEDAARTSGANWFMTMRRVVLPLALPALFAVWIWVFAHCMRELTSALLLQGGENPTLPVVLWGYWVGGQPNRAAAIAVWLIAALLLLMVIWQMIARFSGSHKMRV
jgi:iron(III) transport system permease protein